MGKGEGNLPSVTHTGSSSCAHLGKCVSFTNTATAALTGQKGLISDRRKKFRAVKDEFSASDL